MSLLLTAALTASMYSKKSHHERASQDSASRESASVVAVDLPLTLSAAEQAALAHHPSIARVRAGLAGDEARAQAAGAALWPQWTATATYQRTTANFAPRPGTVPSQFVAGGAASADFFNFFSLGSSVSQLVWDGGRTVGRWESALKMARAAHESVDAARWEVLREVRLAFATAQAQAALVAVAREAVRNADRHVADAAARVDAGLRPPLDLLQARVERSQAAMALAGAEEAEGNARARLCVAMGRPPSALPLLDDAAWPALDDEAAPLSALVTRLRDARPELRRIDRVTEAAEASLAAARGGVWPSLTVSSAFSDVGPALDELTWNWGVQLSLAWTLFDGGLRMADEKEALGRLQAAEAQLREDLQLLALELDGAQRAVATARRTLDEATAARGEAAERLRLAQARYEAGEGTALEESDARLGWAQAAAQVVQARFQLSSARARLASALGS